MPAQSRQSVRQNTIDKTHTWQQCSVTTSEDILTTKYGFNLRQILSTTARDTLAGDRWIQGSVCVAHALIGPHDHSSWHTFEAKYAGSLPYSSENTPLHDLKRAGETVWNARVRTSPPGDHSLAESRHVVLWRLLYVYHSAKNSAEAVYPNFGNRARSRQMRTVLPLFRPLPNVGLHNFGMWGIYDLAKAYRSIEKPIANHRVGDWDKR